MADENPQPERRAQVYRLVEFEKRENPAGAVVSNAFEIEDEYQPWYADAGRDKDVILIQPPYHLKLLDRLAQENNALGPCIEAMVTNIEGTGYEFDRDEDQVGTTSAAVGASWRSRCRSASAASPRC